VKTYSIDDVDAISSPYLKEGRKQESWEIQSIEIDRRVLRARVKMTSLYVSQTDSGFHLTIFSTLEFASQLMIIYAHDWAGLRKKLHEAWMVESTTRAVRQIRNPDDIRVEMNVRQMRRLAKRMICIADFRVTDDADGLFEVTLKGFLS
jgi:hypothetical protein